MSSQSENQQNKEQRDHQPNDHGHNQSSTLDANNHHPSPPPPAAPHHPPGPPPPPLGPSLPPNIQSPPHGFPPAMGYPPPMMYPHGGQYPPGYPPPPPHVYNRYPYGQPPPGTVYYYPATTPPNRAAGCARGCLAAMIIIVILICLSSLFTWAILRPQSPVFHVDNMSVTNWNTSTPFTATWNTNISIQNPNHKLRVYFDKIMVVILYDEENTLGDTWLNPFLMETKSNTSVNAVIAVNGSAQNAVPIWVSQEMGKDRNELGSVIFSLSFRIWATFKSGNWWTRSLIMKVSCDDLKVKFEYSSGTLEPGKRDNCAVYA
ncbi:Late embryogenesis abundant protein, LEA-14 [Corchorus capsularis]|uniref:Late embryogenesis abundant protein, LEA-14 n=1 Tax=Corchorus capsularis TaxID=210143 RepID=A0A1R3IJ24_COCAP|nr:Late embryogenesis abundant protein, LEA-14 [Corchorus capsularis]